MFLKLRIIFTPHYIFFDTLIYRPAVCVGKEAILDVVEIIAAEETVVAQSSQTDSDSSSDGSLENEMELRQKSVRKEMKRFKKLKFNTERKDRLIMLEEWKKISSDYHWLTKVVKFLVVVPFSNAAIERSFASAGNQFETLMTDKLLNDSYIIRNI